MRESSVPMNSPKNLESILSVFQENTVTENEALDSLQEDVRLAQKEILQYGQKRQKLLDNLRKSVFLSKSTPLNREEIQKDNIRLIRDGLASEVEQTCNQIKKDLLFLKAKGDVSKKSEALSQSFQSEIKMYIEKKRLLEQLEKNLDSIRKDQISDSPSQGTGLLLTKYVEMASQLKKELVSITGNLLSTYEQLENQIQKDINSEEAIRTAFYNCASCIEENRQREMYQNILIKCKNNSIETRIAVYKSAVESLVRFNAAAANRFHSLSRKKVQSLLKQKLFDQAATEMCYALYLWKDNTQSYRMLAKILAAKGDFNGAFAALREALRLDPKNMNLRKIIAAGWLKLNNFYQAEQEYELLLSHFPADKECRAGLGKVYFLQKNYAKTIEVLNNYASLDGEDVEIPKLLATSYMYSQNYKLAISPLEFLVKTDLKNEEYTKYLAICYRQTGNSLSAIDLLTDFIRQNNPPSISLYVLLAATYDEIGDIDHAEIVYSNLIASHPASTRSLLLPLANIQVQLGKTEQAIASYTKALRVHQHNPQIVLPLCTLLRQNGHCDFARKILEHAIQKNKGNSDFKQELAVIYLETSQWEKAKQVLDETYTGQEMPS